MASRLAGKESDMAALALLGQFFIGVALLLIGLAALWFVSAYASKKG